MVITYQSYRHRYHWQNPEPSPGDRPPETRDLRPQQGHDQAGEREVQAVLHGQGLQGRPRDGGLGGLEQGLEQSRRGCPGGLGEHLQQHRRL